MCCAWHADGLARVRLENLRSHDAAVLRLLHRWTFQSCLVLVLVQAPHSITILELVKGNPCIDGLQLGVPEVLRRDLPQVVALVYGFWNVPSGDEAPSDVVASHPAVGCIG